MASFKSDALWNEAASAAVKRLEEQGSELEMANNGNTLVACFLLEAESRLDKSDERAEQHAKQLKRAVAYLQMEQLRCHDAGSLSKVKFFGEATVRRVVQHLWSLKPPAPLSHEELAAQEAVRLLVKEDNKAKRAAKAAAKAQTSGGAAASAGNSGLQTGQGGGAAGAAAKGKGKRKAGASAGAEAEGEGSEDEGQAGATKKSKRAPKEYAPAVGTANYAFLIVLYMSLKEGNEYETKQTLMQKAEASGLSSKSLFGVGAATANTGAGGQAGKWYDGWSSVSKSLINRTPPLVQAWSNPKKVRLTTEGVALAARLYQDAVQRCKVTAIPGVDPEQDMAGAGAGAGAGASGSGGLPAAAAPAPAGKPGPSGGKGSGSAGSGAGPPAPLHALVQGVGQAGTVSGSGRAAASGHQASAGPSPSASLAAGSNDDDAIIIIDSDDDGPAGLAVASGAGGVAPRLAASAPSAALAVPTFAAAAPARTAAGRGVADGATSVLPSAAAVAAGAAGAPWAASSRSGVQASSSIAISSGAGLRGSGTLSQARSSVAAAFREPGPAIGSIGVRGGSQLQAHLGTQQHPQPGTQGDSGTATANRHTGQATGYRWGVERLQDCSGCQDPRLPPLPEGVPFEQAYEVVMVMDHREQLRREQGKSRTESLVKLVQRIRDKGITVLVDQALPVGDVLWVARSRTAPGIMYTLDYILERKSISDLSNSIRDQRYGRQKYWMRLCGLARSYYLIEGDVDMEPSLSTVERKAVKTAILSTQLSGFHLLHSPGPHPTLLLLANLTRAIERAYHGRTAVQGTTAPPLKTLDEWSACVKQMQTSVTVRDVFGLILCTVPGLGEAMAEAILAKYPTWHELWQAYKHVLTAASSKGQDGHRAAEALLAAVPVLRGGLASADVAGRTVGPEASRKVYNALFRAAPCAVST